jgi:hypothetical protein
MVRGIQDPLRSLVVLRQRRSIPDKCQREDLNRRNHLPVMKRCNRRVLPTSWKRGYGGPVNLLVLQD